MRRWIGRILKWIGACTLILVALLVYVVLTSDEHLPEAMVLEVDFRRGVVEHIPDHPLALLRGRSRLSVREQVLALSRAASDDRVLGLMGRVGGVLMSLAHIQELADAVAAFRRSGKPTLAFAESIGGLSPANGSYLLASAFQEIRLQPSGSVGLVGLAIEHPFIRGTLDSLGIVPAFGIREDYKNAPNTFTEEGFTAKHLEATKSLLKDQFDQLVAGVARGRGVEEGKVRTWVDQGPHTAQAALAGGLVDELSYIDEARKVFASSSVDQEMVPLKTYAQGVEEGQGTRIAVIYGAGTITSGRSRYHVVGESQSVGSDTLVDAFKDATEDPDVEAILFRVDSPGGSYVASDAIWHATRLAQEKGIPVVVSMASFAASGGYLVATHADRVVAQPGTITGSIGVWAGKFVTRNFWKKLGVTWDEVSFGKQARLGSSLSDFAPEERRRFDSQLNRVYDAFVSQVADGRDLSRERAESAARGRVWTGRQAKAHGLVDQLGGFLTALSATRELLGLDEDADVSLVVFPKPRDLTERILEGDWEELRFGNGQELSVQALLGMRGHLAELLSGPSTWAPWLEGIVH